MHARVGFNCNMKWIQQQSLSKDEHEVWAAMFSHAKSFNMSTISVQNSMLHKWSCSTSAESCFPIPKDFSAPWGGEHSGDVHLCAKCKQAPNEDCLWKKKWGMPKAGFKARDFFHAMVSGVLHTRQRRGPGNPQSARAMQGPGLLRETGLFVCWIDTQALHQLSACSFQYLF